MGAREHTYRFRMPLAVATAVALMLAVMLMRPGPVSSRTAKDTFWTEKVFGTKKYNVVVSGDSRIYRGISSQEMKEAMLPHQVEVLNFGFSAGGHNEEMFDLIEQRLTPSGLRVIVLGLSPFSLTPKGQENGHLHDLLKTPRDKQFLDLRIYPRLMFFDPIEKDEIKAWAKGDSTGYYEDFKPDGWVASTRVPMQPDEALGAYWGAFKDNNVSPAIVEGMLAQVREWNGQGIACFAFRPPTTQGMVHLEDSLSGYDEEILRNRFQQAGGMWLDAGPLDDYTSYDGSHLDRTSAEKFSARLGAEIRMKLIDATSNHADEAP